MLILPSFPAGDTVLGDVFRVLLIKRGSGPDDVLLVGVEASSLWVGVGDSSMSSRPVSLNLVSSFENDLDLLGAGSKSVVLPEQLLKSSLLCPVLCPEWPPLKKCISVNAVWKVQKLCSHNFLAEVPLT